jgi:hypothetical protein
MNVTTTILEYWNDYCREAHGEARDAFCLWVGNGKPRQGPLFDIMRLSRSRFKSALRQCRKLESRAKADAVAKKFLNKDTKLFWKEIKKINCQATPLSCNINGVTGQHNIVKLWQKHYQTLLNSSVDVS